MVEEDEGDWEQCWRITSRNGQKCHIMTVSEWHKIENDGDPWQPTCWLQMAHNDDWWWMRKTRTDSDRAAVVWPGNRPCELHASPIHQLAHADHAILVLVHDIEELVGPALWIQVFLTICWHITSHQWIDSLLTSLVCWTSGSCYFRVINSEFHLNVVNVG